MKKKLLLITLMVALFVCLLLVSVSAAELTNYCDVKITLTTGEQITAYCKIDTNDSSLQRDTAYKAPDTFYIVGSEEECASLVTTLKAQSKGMYLTFIEESEATESTGAGYGIMHTCYNRCDAFYDKNHSMGDPVFNFANVSEKIIYTSVCERCQNEENVKELAPIIEGLGYSARINEDRICVGYKLNNDSINAYNEATGITLTFGVVAISPINDDELKPLYVENGEVKPLDYTISAALDGDFASFDFIISGFNDSYYSKELVMCAYVFDGESIKYIC